MTRRDIEAADPYPIRALMGRRLEAHSIEQACARALGFAREPAQQPRRVGREEVVTRRAEDDEPHRGGVETNPPNLARERARQVELVRRFLDELDDGDAKAPKRRRARASEAGEARPDDHDIEVGLRC
jgi:hypothetical protein